MGVEQLIEDFLSDIQRARGVPRRRWPGAYVALHSRKNVWKKDGAKRSQDEHARRLQRCLPEVEQAEKAVQATPFMSLQDVRGEQLEFMHPLLPTESGCDIRSVKPLLDMALSTKDERLLSEVAAGLMSAAQDDSLGQELRTPEACKAIKKLMQINSFGVAYPTANVLLRLAKADECFLEKCFLEAGLLRTMVDNLCSLEVGIALLEQLAQAISRIIRAVKLSNEDAQHVTLQLSRVLLRDPPKSQMFRQSLEEAQQHLGTN